MTTPTERRAATLADAAGLILTDATAQLAETPSTNTSACAALIDSMVDRRASLTEYVELMMSVTTAASMAVAAELRASVDDDTDAGPAVRLLASLCSQMNAAGG